MDQTRRSSRRAKRAARPLDAAKLEELAMAYVARFATTAARLENYLKRKLRERGFAGAEEGEEPGVTALVERFVARGYVDDASYARARAGGLLRRGYGARRVAQALMAAGVAEDLRQETAPGEAARRAAAVAFARKRRLGPFGSPATPPDPAMREKQLAAFLRAGHDFAAARIVLDAGTAEELEEWVAEAREGEDE